MPVTSSRWVPDRPVIATSLTAMGVKNVTKSTLRMLNRARVMCPVDTGNLRNSHQMAVRVVPGRRVTGEVFTKVKYARAVHNGRRAVTIRPKYRKALHFWWHGREHFAKVVHQPARRGRPWLRTALREVAAADGYKLTRNPKYL